MDGEVSTLIADIQSLLAQIEQVSGNGGGEVEEGAVKMAEDSKMTDTMPDGGGDDSSKLEAIKKILKAMSGEDEGSAEDEKEDKVEKSDEGPNASDNAESRIDDGQGEVNDKNVNEVAKALAMLLGRKSVAKSAQPKQKQSSDMDRIMKALDKIVERVGEQEKAIIGIYEGLGVADEIKKSASVQPVEKARPKNDPNEIKKSAEYIREMLGIETPNKEKSVEGRFSLKKALLENDGLALSAMMSTKQK